VILDAQHFSDDPIATIRLSLVRPIEVEIDVEARRGRFRVRGIVESVGEPIRNPVTGAEHRVRITDKW
jgi:hypothetical protein